MCFNHIKGTPKNELKHNRGNLIAVIGKNKVYISRYTPNTKRFLSSTSFDNPKKLAENFDKNQIYAKGGEIYKGKEPKKCPVCGSGVDISEEGWIRCVNDECEWSAAVYDETEETKELDEDNNYAKGGAVKVQKYGPRMATKDLKDVQDEVIKKLGHKWYFEPNQFYHL